MSLTAAAIRLLGAKGLSVEEIADVAEANTCAPTGESSADRRRRLDRERKQRARSADKADNSADNSDAVPPNNSAEICGMSADKADKSPPLARVVDTKLPTEVVINPLPSPSETTPAKPKSPLGSRLPDDWQPDFEAALAVGLGRDAAAQQADRFRDYWRGVPGAKGRKADWPATWRNWCRRTVENLPKAPANGERPDPKRVAREANYTRALAGIEAAARMRN